jgi:hypothetical protein
VDYTGEIIKNNSRMGYLPQELLTKEKELSAYEFMSADLENGNGRYESLFLEMDAAELSQICRQLKLPLEMFYSEQQVVDACTEEPSTIFNVIKNGDFEIIEKLLEENKLNVNICDGVGNDLVTRLLKAKQYDLVIEVMKKRNWDVNHQNIEGNTFGHILVLDNSVGALRVMEQLIKKKNFTPNIKNNKGETMLDRAINNNYIYTVFKILEDKRCNDIDLITFKKLYKTCIRNSYYGIYSKLNNLEVIVDNLDKKELEPDVRRIIDVINDNMEYIKTEIMRNRSSILENIINSTMNEATA